LVDVTEGDETIRAIYKAEDGERPLWDFPEGLWRREVAASILDQLLRFDLVPLTIARPDGPFGGGSLQVWIDDATDDHYFTLREREEFENWFGRLALFDVLANNTDRKSGHVLFDGTRCWAIDHGVCFHEEPKLRTVVWEFAGQELPDSLREALEELTDDRLALLEPYLAAEEREAVAQRRDDLIVANHFPLPNEEGDYPPYPWPLI
jgi:hypothetical protein